MKGCDSGLDGGSISQADRIAFARQAGDEGLKAFKADVVQTSQFAQRFSVVVNAQIEFRINLTRVNAQRSGLFAALVTACSLTRLHRGNESFSQRSSSHYNERLCRGIEHLWACQHVAGNAEIFKNLVTAPVNTLPARMRRGSPVNTHYVQLTLLAAPIGINESTYNLARGQATGKKL